MKHIARPFAVFLILESLMVLTSHATAVGSSIMSSDYQGAQSLAQRFDSINENDYLAAGTIIENHPHDKTHFSKGYRLFSGAPGFQLDPFDDKLTPAQTTPQELDHESRSLQRNRAGIYDVGQFFPCGDETSAGSQLFCVSGRQTCVRDKFGMPTCECFEGLTGINCLEQVNECLPDVYPCPAENSYCVMLAYPQRYKCSCMPGFTPRLPVVWDNAYVPAEYRPEACLPPDTSVAPTSTETLQPIAPSAVSVAPTTPLSSTPAPVPLAPGSCIITADCAGQLNNNYHCDSDGKCTCRDGYSRLSNNCIDRNECADDTWNICHRFANCRNLPGTYSCECQEGFEDAFDSTQPGTVCQQVNECEKGLHDCDSDSICIDRSPPIFWECVTSTTTTSQTSDSTSTKPTTISSTTTTAGATPPSTTGTTGSTTSSITTPPPPTTTIASTIATTSVTTTPPLTTTASVITSPTSTTTPLPSTTTTASTTTTTSTTTSPPPTTTTSTTPNTIPPPLTTTTSSTVSITTTTTPPPHPTTITSTTTNTTPPPPTTTTSTTTNTTPPSSTTTTSATSSTTTPLPPTTTTSSMVATTTTTPPLPATTTSTTTTSATTLPPPTTTTTTASTTTPLPPTTTSTTSATTTTTSTTPLPPTTTSTTSATTTTTSTTPVPPTTTSTTSATTTTTSTTPQPLTTATTASTTTIASTTPVTTTTSTTATVDLVSEVDLCPDRTVDNTTGYGMCLDFAGTMTESDKKVFMGARSVWVSKITGDLPAFSSISFLSQQYACNGGYPAKIDDLYLCSKYEKMDGVSGVLGYAGFVYKRSDKPGKLGLPLVGSMNFDIDDINALRADGRLEAVIVHEMAHVLGVGTLWRSANLTNHTVDTNGNTIACPYSGVNANREWREISGCTTNIPIELDGGAGTQCLHWDEDCLKDEIMTGWITKGVPPKFSKITIGSMEDLGYTVDYNQAESYMSSDLAASCSCKRRRGLRGGDSRLLQLGASTTTANDENSPKPVLSEELREMAIAQGEAKLAEAAASNDISAPIPGVEFGADKYISVIVQENGNIFGVDVFA